MIEAIGSVVGDIFIGRWTPSHKQQDNVALMTQIHDTCDLKYYDDAQRKLEWGQVVQHEMNYLEKNHTQDLVP